MKKIAFVVSIITALSFSVFADDAKAYDIVIYGGSPAAVSAAVQAKRMGKSAVIVLPDVRIGGLTTGGLGQTDIGNKHAFGGIALEFYRGIAQWYRDEKNWTRQKRDDYLPDGQCAGTKGEDSMWTFEPSAALAVIEGWIRRDAIEVVRGEKLDRAPGGVVIKDGRILSFKTLSGRVFKGKMFVDATYEGDLMAAAGVTYIVGRESNAKYGETLSGCQRAYAIHHQFVKGVSAYVKEGDPSSGLLPGVTMDDRRPDGTGDKFVQAYCFRMCLTDDPENRIPFKKPSSYNEQMYELLFRQLAARGEEYYESENEWRLPWINSKMPNRKTDTNNRDGFSTDFIGMNWAWPEASYEEREKIFKAHLDYQRGLMWTLANHPRVPQTVRRDYSRWGTCRDEFTDGPGDGWQSQLYVREARRMVGEYVMTEANCRGKRTVRRPVAMGAYTMDSHHVRRLADKNGNIFNEGDVEVSHNDDGMCIAPYQIEYGAIIPKYTECKNIFVPVCLSASHIAFGSIRMEPVFFALGQVAGTAAAQAIDADCSVQDLPYTPLQVRLVADGQVLMSEPPTEVVVAASNARDFEKRAADFVCTGKNDERVINAALSLLTRGGTLRLADGDYYIDSFENEGNSAVYAGYNNGNARAITVTGTTENKSYNTRFGVTLHVTKGAMDAMKSGETYRVFFGASRKPKVKGDFFTYTHVNNMVFRNFYIYFDNASKNLIGIDGRNYGSMELDLIGIFQKDYFHSRFMHEGAPSIPCDGTVGVYSVPSSNDEMARNRYNEVNVGGLYRGFVFEGVDHLVMTGCSAARCVYGYWFVWGTPKTLTLINCCDEGNTYLPYFGQKGHVTMIDFNIERFNAKFISTDCRGARGEHGAREEIPGSWRGFISYTLQGSAYGLAAERGAYAPGRFWRRGDGKNIKTVDLNADR